MSDLIPHATLELSFSETSRRAELEQVIAHGVATFITVGNALLEIRDSRLYRDTHATFENYCVERWKFARNYANKLIAAAGVATNLGTIVLTQPANESQVRLRSGTAMRSLKLMTSL